MGPTDTRLLRSMYTLPKVRAKKPGLTRVIADGAGYTRTEFERHSKRDLTVRCAGASLVAVRVTCIDRPGTHSVDARRSELLAGTASPLSIATPASLPPRTVNQPLYPNPTAADNARECETIDVTFVATALPANCTCAFGA